MDDLLIANAATFLVKDLFESGPLHFKKKVEISSSENDTDDDDDDEEDHFFYTKLRKCSPIDGQETNNSVDPLSDFHRTTNDIKCPPLHRPTFMEFLMNRSDSKFFSYFRFSRKTFNVQVL